MKHGRNIYNIDFIQLHEQSFEMNWVEYFFPEYSHIDARQATPHCIESFCFIKGSVSFYLLICGVLNLPKPVLSLLDSISILPSCLLDFPTENVYVAVKRTIC